MNDDHDNDNNQEPLPGPNQISTLWMDELRARSLFITQSRGKLSSFSVPQNAYEAVKHLEVGQDLWGVAKGGHGIGSLD